MIQIELRYKFESAHRLSTPTTPRKCQSIHGHSFYVTVCIQGEKLDADGMLVEFGSFKSALNRWIDANADHTLFLRDGDPVADAIHAAVPDMRIRLFDGNPTTEAIAKWIYERCVGILHEELNVPASHATIAHVHIQETCTNAVRYSGSAST